MQSNSTVTSSQVIASSADDRRWLAWLQSRQPFSRRVYAIITLALLCLWLAVVVFTTTRHEYIRDEVRPLSLARQAQSMLDLPGLIRDDGHPLLWYVLLYIAKAIVDTPLILPIISISVAFAAVVIFLYLAPFPFLMRVLFIFGGLPFYEYSVSARNYGISMLLMFIVALLYRRRQQAPLLLGLALALLANTNVHSLVFAGCITAIWAWDARALRRPLSPAFILSLAIIVAGAIACVAVTFPRPDNILTGFYHVTPLDVANAVIDSVVIPGRSFADIVPPLLPSILGTSILYLTIAGLWQRRDLFLAALATQFALAVFFQVGYGGSYRHEGLYLVFLLLLYWIASESPARPKATARAGPLLYRIGRYGALMVLVLSTVPSDRMIWVDIRKELSSSKALGAFLNQSPLYHDAIILPEPDYFIESLPYYAQNPIYLPREHRFSNTVVWTTAADSDLTLGQLMADARDMQARYGRPVLIVFNHWEVFNRQSGQLLFSYNKSFTWSAAERRDADQSLAPVAEFMDAVGDEKYDVIALK
jgi:hypothetical protein